MDLIHERIGSVISTSDISFIRIISFKNDRNPL